jgi:hypothetical protein
MGDEEMKKLWVVVIGNLFILTPISQLVITAPPEDEDFNFCISLNQLNRIYSDDSIPVYAGEEFYGSIEASEYEELEVHVSSDPTFGYMVHSPYYKAYFKGSDMKVVVSDSWIIFSLKDKESGEVQDWEVASDLKAYQDEYLDNILTYMKESGVGTI